jgi:hypothetical protein
MKTISVFWRGMIIEDRGPSSLIYQSWRNIPQKLHSLNSPDFYPTPQREVVARCLYRGQWERAFDPNCLDPQDRAYRHRSVGKLSYSGHECLQPGSVVEIAPLVAALGRTMSSPRRPFSQKWTGWIRTEAGDLGRCLILPRVANTRLRRLETLSWFNGIEKVRVAIPAFRVESGVIRDRVNTAMIWRTSALEMLMEESKGNI